MVKVLCITRKYPPSIGGMEKLCYNLFSSFTTERQIEKKIIALGKSQKHLIWFLPYCVFYVIFNARRFDVIYYGDSLLCGPAFFGKLFSPKTKAAVEVHGLDVSFPNWLYQTYLKCFYKCFDCYICNSRNTEKLLHQREIRNTIVIKLPVEIDRFDYISCDKPKLRKKYGIPENAMILLTVGRLVRRKGVEWFVANVMPRLFKENIYYFVVGSGGEEERIKATISAKGLDNYVKLMGRISEEDLNDLYVNSDVFVMPNIPVENDPEGFGLVALEASLAGLVVLASDVDGISDAVIDGHNGYLLAPENSDDYEKKILEIKKEAPYINSIVKKFSQYTKEKYSLDAISGQYIDVFKRLAESKTISSREKFK